MKIKDETRVLIAEDDFMVSQMIRSRLESLGYQVAGEVEHGGQVLEMVQALQPDVILMDIEMPVLNGIEAMMSIQEYCPTPVVVLTAYETPELVAQASAAGAGAYLLKPPRLSDLERAITIAIARFADMIELRYLNRELQSRNEELDAFASTVAHSLRSPLNSIARAAGVLDEKTRLPEELQDNLNIVIRNSHKMNGIIDELQLLAGVRQAQVELKPLSMGRIVAEAQRRLVYLIEEHQARLSLPDHWPVTLGYEPWVEEVWTNYLSNAIMYGGRPPRLQLGATIRSDGMVRLWIRDNGPGFTAEEQARLFKPFIRLDEVQATGYGLGLSIVRRIVEKLGGQVGVESEGVPGRGSIFSFTLRQAAHLNEG